MAKKKGILRRETIVVDGKAIEVDTFDAKVVLGSGAELESIDELLTQERIEKEIQKALEKIQIIASRYPEKEKDIGYCFEVGKVLQFVDVKGFTKRRGLIWRRMAYDLRPDLFGGKKKDPDEAKRYPETMYHLGKQSEEDIGKATFDQWYEILKFKELYKNKRLLNQVFEVCKQGLVGAQLRQRIKELRAARE